MQNKNRLRYKYFFIRKKKYFEINSSFFNPLKKLFNKEYKNKKVNLSSYYPTSFEVDTIKLFETKLIRRLRISLPVIKENNEMQFHEWKKNDVLRINKFGILEPGILTANIIPDVMLVPLLAFDNKNNRLGYGGGFYDRYINKYLNTYKKILTIGIAFSFQKHHKIPVFNNDVKLNYILTEKGIF